MGETFRIGGELAVRRLGVTVGQLEQCLALTTIAAVQNRYNILDRESDDVLKVCEARQLAFLHWFPLGQGSISAESAGRAALGEVARRHGATVGLLLPIVRCGFPRSGRDVGEEGRQDPDRPEGKIRKPEVITEKLGDPTPLPKPTLTLPSDPH
jgi:aryl-alcohol dehydrogenase-like predicted oxidoreductase